MTPPPRATVASPHPVPGEVPGWRDLRHGGLLLDSQRLTDLAPHAPASMNSYTERQLRRHHAGDDASALVKFVLEQVCGFDSGTGTWTRGTKVAPEWGRRAVTGESVKPRALWQGLRGGRLPVFWEQGGRVGIGKGRRTVSRVLGWLRAGNDHLALVTNGKQWRLLFAGLDFEAWCEWDADLWFEDGKPTPPMDALRTLLQPVLWTPASKDADPPLLQAIRDTRKGQAELSETLGERVREAVETLIQGHGEALKDLGDDVDPADIYRAACRVAMRLVVVLFAESRDLLPRDNAVYHASYGLNGLLERLQKASGGNSLSARYSAWHQVLALFSLVRNGSHLPELPVKDYGGELFEPGCTDSTDGVSRALAVFETACLQRDVLPDSDVLAMLERMTRTRTRIRQGRAGTWVTVPVDFSDLSSDYIGILYEGLLDYELKTAAPGEPVIFLAAGQCPALPLSRLEAMDDSAIKTLFRNLKTDRSAADGSPDGPAEKLLEEGVAAEHTDVDNPLFDDGSTSDAPPPGHDERHVNRTRAEVWARKAAQVAGLVQKPRGKLTPERRLKAETDAARKASKLVDRVVLPGEWYLVRWGGTRKGSGSFYTRPGLVVPTVQRTLRPLAYAPPHDEHGEPDRDAPPVEWTPKPPEEILELKVCDPACGSGAFVLSALRFLTDALLASLQHHGRVEPYGDRTMVRVLGRPADTQSAERLGDELIPCPPDHDDFEPRLSAVLRRYVVEHCIYAVDLDPLAVELCRLSLWIETMDRSLPFGFLDHKVKCGNSLVGAWLDQFAHYPVMAWKNREGGDNTHTNWFHFKKGVRTKAIKAFVKDTLKPDLARFLGDPDLFLGDYLKRHGETRGRAQAVLERMHALPVQDAAERARTYRQEFAGSADWLSLKEAMDLWCACWYWPADEIAVAPLPTTLADPPPETRGTARRIAIEVRFFHWELEFPDVFCDEGSGFDAVLGNPPWDIAKPDSREFFSNIDPLYRSYGNQEARRKQKACFANPASGKASERAWINYNARFRAQSNYVKYVARSFGDPKFAEKDLERFSIARGRPNASLHQRWRRVRRTQSLTGLADGSHPFRWQGSADLNLYKLFLEASYSLLRQAGRLGIIVPSGLYSDYGTRALRRLFLEQSRWEWLFGIENRHKLFPIDGRYKFNPVIVQKGGATDAVMTAFMRHNLDDWDAAESIAVPYARSQVEQFSPNSRALLEVQSKRDLEVLEKVYAHGVLLGDDGPEGWGVRWATEFNITSDSKVFPPRPHWEAKGYRPDEYSRWVSGRWRPIDDLRKLSPGDIDHYPTAPTSSDARTVGDPDVAMTDWAVRCAQSPYDRIPVARSAIQPGIVLAREGDAWISEDDIDGIAIPLYEGRMIGQNDYSQKAWISGKGRTAVWREIPWLAKRLEPQYLMDQAIYLESDKSEMVPKIAYMRISSATNTRTVISSYAHRHPTCDSVFLYVPTSGDLLSKSLVATAVLCTYAFDSTVRMKMVGLNLNEFLMNETVMPRRDSTMERILLDLSADLNLIGPLFATERLRLGRPFGRQYAISARSRMQRTIALDALVALWMGISCDDFRYLLAGCDGIGSLSGRHSNAKGFWRVDKGKDPELRQTVLTQIAYSDLVSKIDAASGDRNRGVQAFLEQNNGEGWLIPETLRLADYGLGHDERAKQHQPVASRLGPRFYDWQLAQSPEEAWQECHLHARNLLGAPEYARLLEDLGARRRQEGHTDVSFLLNDYTRNLIGDAVPPDPNVAQNHQSLMRAAEPKKDYTPSLFATDDPP